MLCSWKENEGPGQRTVEVTFDNAEEFRKEFTRRLTARQLVVTRTDAALPSEGETLTLELHIPCQTSFTFLARVLKSRAAGEGGEALLSLLDMTAQHEEAMRSCAAYPGVSPEQQLEGTRSVRSDEVEGLLQAWRRRTPEESAQFLARLSQAELQGHLGSLRQAGCTLHEQGRIAEAAVILLILGRFAAVSPVSARLVQNIMDECTDDSALAYLHAQAMAAQDEQRQQWVEVLAACGPKAAPWLLSMLRKAEDRKSRMAAIEALRKMGSSIVPLLLRELYLPDMEWYYVRNLLVLAQELDMAEAVPVAECALRQKHPSLRSEALKALLALKGADAHYIVISMLRDADTSVARTAVMLLRQMRPMPSEARRFLLDRIREGRPPADGPGEDMLIEILHTVATLEDAAEWESPLLGLLDTFPAHPIINRLLRRMDERPFGLLLALLNALGATGGQRAWRTLRTKLLWETDPTMRRAMTDAMDKIKSRRGVAD